MDTPAGTIKVIVKTPLSADGKEDFTVEAVTQWNIRQLKEHLSTVLPKKTSADDQKLIFSGSVLSDELLLKDCFRSVALGSYPVVHLVCKHVAPVSLPNLSTPHTSTPHTSTPHTPTDASEGLHRRNVQQPASSVPPAPTSSPWVGTPTFNPSAPSFSPWPVMPTYDPAHMAQYYQAYQAYLQQYMYTQMATNPMNLMNPMNPMNPLNPLMRLPETAAVGQHQVRFANGTPNGYAANVVRMNHLNHPNHLNPLNHPAGHFGMPHNGRQEMGGDAPALNGQNAEEQGGGGVGGGGAEQRDAFDNIYIAFRVVALLLAVYFSSSTSRFFSAFTMLSVFLLFNTIRDFRRWRERQLRRNAQVAPPAGEGVAVPPQGAEPGAQPAQGAEAGAQPPQGGEAGAGAAQPPQGGEAGAQGVQPEAGLFGTVLSLVVGFITSLVPDVNGVVA